MLTHEEMIGLQAESIGLVGHMDNFSSKEEYVLHLIHAVAYERVSRLVQNKKVLDIGCNTGYGTAILYAASKEAVGVDISKKAISFAREKYGSLGIKFHVIDGSLLPFADGVFDVITGFQLIEHIVDYERFIDEIKRVMTPNGIVVFSTPNALIRLDPGMKPWNKFHVREFEDKSLKLMLENSFGKVWVLGLFVREPLYSIDIRRLSKAREKARRRNKKNYLSKYLLHSLPVKQYSKTVINLVKNITYKTIKLEYSSIKDYGTESFYYKQKELDVALDFLAVCCKDVNVLNKAMEALSYRSPSSF